MEQHVLSLPGGDHALLYDSAEQIRRCLECPLPPGACYGEKNCMRQSTVGKVSRSKRIVAMVQQGKDRGEIARALHTTSAMISTAILYAVRTGRLTQAEAEASKVKGGRRE